MNRSLRRVVAACLGMVATAVAVPVAAQQGADSGETLKKVRERQAIYLGYAEDAIPFTFVGEGGGVRGYGWDLCGQVVQAVRETLGVPSVKVVAVPVTPTTRVLALRSGMIDVDCSGVASTPSRQRQVAFSPAVYVATVKVLVKSDSPVRTLADLDGKRVVTTLASGMERHVKTAAPLRGANIDFASATSQGEAMAMLGAGKADAFVLDDIPLAELKARLPDPAAYRWLEENLAMEAHALALPSGDEPFRQLVERTIESLAKAGELERLYGRWFTSPALPGGVNLQLPMSPMLRDRLANPAKR